MKRYYCFLGVGLLMFFAGCASQQDRLDMEESGRVVGHFLSALDSYDDLRVWSYVASVTKESIGRERQVKYWFGLRKQLGATIQRDLQYNWKRELNVGPLPDGNHRQIVYWSKFENQDLAKERIVVTFEEGE